MMAGYAAHPVVRETFSEASDVLGQDLWALVDQGPVDALSLTTNTQPVMLTAGIAALRAWQAEGGPMPAVVAGHSLGEYTALVAAGALAFRDALPLVRFRAQAMQEAVPRDRARWPPSSVATTAPWCPHARKPRRGRWSKR
jgi:[acyl-carrier-protein] S-malonyltransferase